MFTRERSQIVCSLVVLYFVRILQGKTHRWALAWSFSALSPGAVLPHGTVLVLRAPMGGSSAAGGGFVADSGRADGGSGLASTCDSTTRNMDFPSPEDISGTPNGGSGGGGGRGVPSSSSSDVAERRDDPSRADSRKRTAEEPPPTEARSDSYKRRYQDAE